MMKSNIVANFNNGIACSSVFFALAGEPVSDEKTKNENRLPVRCRERR